MGIRKMIVVLDLKIFKNIQNNLYPQRNASIFNTYCTHTCMWHILSWIYKHLKWMLDTTNLLLIEMIDISWYWQYSTLDFLISANFDKSTQLLFSRSICRLLGYIQNRHSRILLCQLIQVRFFIKSVTEYCIFHCWFNSRFKLQFLLYYCRSLPLVMKI